MIYSSLAICVADDDAPIGGWRFLGEPLDAFASFQGFDN
jgi:hypothetical protein